MPEDNGARDRAISDCSHLHYSEDTLGRAGTKLPMLDSREILCSEHCPEQHGYEPTRKTINSTSQTHYKML